MLNKVTVIFPNPIGIVQYTKGKDGVIGFSTFDGTNDIVVHFEGRSITMTSPYLMLEFINDNPEG